MTLFSKQEIGQRLELMKDVVFKLRECGKSSKKEFIEDFRISDSAIRKKLQKFLLSSLNILLNLLIAPTKNSLVMLNFPPYFS